MQYVGSHSSRELFELVKSIGECRSKQEEDRIILNEAECLQSKFLESGISSSKLREYLIRAIYVEMLGHDASFAYIHAIKMTHDKNSLTKRVGYLACCIFLNSNHELLVLLVNTLQRDLISRNQLDVSAALSSLSRLVNLEMLPSIESSVIKLLGHQIAAIRRKAYLVTYKLLSLRPEIITDNPDILERGVCDVDISVVNAALHLVKYTSHNNPDLCTPLIPFMVATLKQILDHNIPREYDYHWIPAPWVQVHILDIFASVASREKSCAEQVYEIIQATLKRAELSIATPMFNGSVVMPVINPNISASLNGGNISYAILQSCIRTITFIHPSLYLIELAANTISKFLQSDHNHLRSVGISCLSRIVSVNPIHAIPHQMVVVNCLEDSDETLRRKTLDLLCQMTNPKNVETVVAKLMSHLRISTDIYFRSELSNNIVSLSERFAPNYNWYLTTTVNLLEIAGKLVSVEKAYNIAQIIAEGPTGDETIDTEFRFEATNLFINVLEDKVEKLPEILCNLAIWVVGEYGCIAKINNKYINSLESVHKTVNLLTSIFNRLQKKTKSWETYGLIIKAAMKCFSIALLLVLRNKNLVLGIIKDDIESPEITIKYIINTCIPMIEACEHSPNQLIRQRANEFRVLINFEQLDTKIEKNIPLENLEKNKILELFSSILPFDASCEDIQVDKKLSFLDSVTDGYKQKYMMNFSKSARINFKSIPAKNLTKYKDISLNLNTTDQQFQKESKDELNMLSHNSLQTDPLFKSIHNDTNISELPDEVQETPYSGTSIKTEGMKRWGPDGYKPINELAMREKNKSVINNKLGKSNSLKPQSSSNEKLGFISKTESLGKRIIHVDSAIELQKQKEAMALFSGIVSRDQNSPNKKNTDEKPTNKSLSASTVSNPDINMSTNAENSFKELENSQSTCETCNLLDIKSTTQNIGTMQPSIKSEYEAKTHTSKYNFPVFFPLDISIIDIANMWSSLEFEFSQNVLLYDKDFQQVISELESNTCFAFIYNEDSEIMCAATTSPSAGQIALLRIFYCNISAPKFIVTGRSNEMPIAKLIVQICSSYIQNSGEFHQKYNHNYI
ncbi:adaptin family protein [Cryptosporidium serpentis]